MMGFDVWGSGHSAKRYLQSCATSPKYQSGLWLVLECDTGLVSSLLLYSEGFGLPAKALGLGSLATAPNERRQGFGAYLLRGVLASERCRAAPAIYLHSDIAPGFYEQFGFEEIGESAPGTMCMVRRAPSGDAAESLVPPTYF